MNILHYLTHTRYISILMILLGISFQLSTAASNIIFYLLSLSGLIMTIMCLKTQKEIVRQVISSPIWRMVTLWLLLLYASCLYSDAEEMLYQFAKKYLRYWFVGPIALLALIKLSENEDLTKRFFFGFALGGAFTFSLSILNKSTGWLTTLAHDGWFSLRYVKYDYWVSNEAFAHSVFMAILFAYGLMAWTRNQKKLAAICCLAGFIEVFIVSSQRTGYIAIVILSLWFLAMALPTWKKKIIAASCIFALTFIALSSDNPVSKRIDKISQQWQQCDLQESQQNINQLGKLCFSSIGLRKLFWSDGLNDISNSWLIGHGMGDVSVKSLTPTKDSKEFAIIETHNPHNEYILQGIQLGIIGIVIILFLFLITFLEAIKLKKKRKLLYSGIVIVYAASSLYNSFLFDALESLFFVLLLAFIIAERAFEQKNI